MYFSAKQTRISLTQKNSIINMLKYVISNYDYYVPCTNKDNNLVLVIRSVIVTVIKTNDIYVVFEKNNQNLRFVQLQFSNRNFIWS